MTSNHYLQQDPNPCRIIGVLDDGANSLSSTDLAYIQRADVLIGSTRTLQLFNQHTSANCQIHDLTKQLKTLPDWIRSARQANQLVVVLATGDPLCHGIAQYLARHLCIDALDISPNLSTIQLACARVGFVWNDAKIISIHCKDMGAWQRGSTPEHGLYPLAQAVRQHDRLCILTSPENTPARIAQLLMTEDLHEQFLMAVAENLLQSDERTYPQLTPQEAADMEFATLNVVLLWRTQAVTPPVLFGLPDSHYQQRQPDKGLITKQAIRAVTLARMQLTANSTVWDIGAGSGSVGLEAARLCRDGHVWAIEKNEADFAIAQNNHAAHAVSNYTILHGRASEHIANLPPPHAVFIGGSGGEIQLLIEHIWQVLHTGGHLVINVITLENLHHATQTLKNLQPAPQWDILQLQAARSKPILGMHRMAAENPVWIICATKEKD